MRRITITLIDNRADKANAFARGTHFLKIRHRRSGKQPDELVRVSHEPVAKKIEVELIEQYGISIEEMRAAVRFAHAVHKMIANCGRTSRKILLECSFEPKVIESVARTAPTRQRYELEQIAKGKRPLLKPKSGVPVLDTERFSEVVGRLARARGLVLMSLARVKLLACGIHVDSSGCSGQMDQLSDIIGVSKVLRSLVDAYGVMPRNVVTNTASQTLHSQPATLRDACRGNASALGLIAKNNRDIPRLAKKVKPTPEDAYQIKRELTAIMKAAREQRKLLKAIARTTL